MRCAGTRPNCSTVTTSEHARRVSLTRAVRQGAAAAGLVPALASALPRWFAATRHSAFLYVASELVKVFGGDAALAPQLGAAPACPRTMPPSGNTVSGG